MAMCDNSHYYVDFSDNDSLTNDEKDSLEKIQKLYKPIERVEFLMAFKNAGKITSDQFEAMTGLPYTFEI